MQDFDEQRKARVESDRSFQIGGQTFVREAGVRPEVLARWEDVDESTSNSDALAILDELVLAFIEDTGDARERWTGLRARTSDPITLMDMMDLVRWCIRETTGRPTLPPSDFSAGRDETGTPSTGDSSSPAAREELAA